MTRSLSPSATRLRALLTIETPTHCAVRSALSPPSLARQAAVFLPFSCRSVLKLCLGGVVQAGEIDDQTSGPRESLRNKPTAVPLCAHQESP